MSHLYIYIPICLIYISIYLYVYIIIPYLYMSISHIPISLYIIINYQYNKTTQKSYVPNHQHSSTSQFILVGIHKTSKICVDFLPESNGTEFQYIIHRRLRNKRFIKLNGEIHNSFRVGTMEKLLFLLYIKVFNDVLLKDDMNGKKPPTTSQFD